MWTKNDQRAMEDRETCFCNHHESEHIEGEPGERLPECRACKRMYTSRSETTMYHDFSPAIR